MAGVCGEEIRGQEEESKDYDGRSAQKQYTSQCRENMMLRKAENCEDRVRIAPAPEKLPERLYSKGGGNLESNG